MLGSFSPADAGLKELERSLEKRRQRESVEGYLVKDMWYDVGETFRRDGCKDVKCTCHWDGQVSCRQEGNEREVRFSKGITSNDRSLGGPSMYTDTTHNTILFIGTSTMRDTINLIRSLLVFTGVCQSFCSGGGKVSASGLGGVCPWMASILRKRS